MSRHHRELSKTYRVAQLRRVLVGRGFRCHWCGCHVVQLAGIPLENRRVVKHHFLLYTDSCGVVRGALRATTDHVVPLSEGGSCEDGNVVVACFWCNERRGAQWERHLKDEREASVTTTERNESMLDPRDRPRYCNMRHLLAWLDRALVNPSAAPIWGGA